MWDTITTRAYIGSPFLIINAKWSLVFWYFATSSQRLITASSLVYSNDNNFHLFYKIVIVSIYIYIYINK